MIEREVFTEVFGVNKEGQLRGYGLGVRSSHRNTINEEESGRLKQ